MIQTTRTGGTEHPEEMLDFLMTHIIDQSGVKSIAVGGDFYVEAQSTPNMTVKVNLGYAFIKKSDGSKVFPVRMYSSAENATITANASGNTRIDAVVLLIDTAESPNATVTNVAELGVVAGTPSASPTAPSDSDISTAIGASNPFIRLANVTVGSGVTEIVNANIADTREQVLFSSAFLTADDVITWTNKTLTTPVIASLYQDAGKTKLLKMPSATDTLVGKATTDTLTNKTLTTPVIPSIYQDAGKSKLMTMPDTASDTLVSLNATQTLANKTFTNPKQTIVTASDGSTVTFNLTNGHIQQVTLGGNRTLALSNVSAGDCFVLRLIQDGTGSRTVNWFSTIKWTYGTAPTLTTTGGKTDVFGFICTSSGNYDGYIIGQNL